MKNKILVSFSFFCSLSFNAYANGIINNTLQSSSSIFSGVQPARTFGLEKGFLNPASLADLKDKIYISVSDVLVKNNHVIESKKTNKQYSSNQETHVPSLLIAKKYIGTTFYLTHSAVGGRGVLDFGSDGIPLMDTIPNQISYLLSQNLGADVISLSEKKSFRVKEEIIGTNIGFAKAFTKNTNLALSFRYVSGKQKVKGAYMVKSFLKSNPTTIIQQDKYEIDSSSNANGTGYTISVNHKKEKYNISVRFDSRVNLNFKVDSKKNNFLAGEEYPDLKNNSNYRKDLAETLATGIEYNIDPTLKLLAGFSLYIQDNKSYDDSAVDNGYDLALSLFKEYSDNLSIGGSFAYNKTGGNKKTRTQLASDFDGYAIGFGGVYKINEKFAVNFSHGRTLYDTSEAKDLFGEYKIRRNVNVFGIGVELNI